MPDIEISREEADLVLNDYKTAIEKAENLLKREAVKLRTPPDAFGAEVDGKKSLGRAKQNGQNIYQYAKDYRDALVEDEKAVRAGFNELFGTDFDSKIDIDKVQPETTVEKFA